MDRNKALQSISTEMVRQITLVIALVICLCIAIMIIVWSRQPEQRPLISNIELVDAVKVVDVLEHEDINYRTNLQAQMIYVSSKDMDQARLALARIGLVIDYPDIYHSTDPESACTVLEEKIFDSKQTAKEKPLVNQEWFQSIVRLLCGTLIIIVLILSVVRPMLRELIYPHGSDSNSQ